MRRRSGVFIVVLSVLALAVPWGARAANSSSVGIQIDAMTGVFGTLDPDCRIDREATGLCHDAGFYIYSTYGEVNPIYRCDTYSVFPADSGWVSGPGNCEVTDSSGGSVGTDTDATLSRGSLPCNGFAIYFDTGVTPDIYYDVLPDLSSQRIRFGPMTGRVWTEVNPPVTINSSDPPKDQYVIHMQMKGIATGASGRQYRLTLNLEGHAIGQGSCASDIPYSDWWFEVAGNGVLRSLSTV